MLWFLLDVVEALSSLRLFYDNLHSDLFVVVDNLVFNFIHVFDLGTNIHRNVKTTTKTTTTK